jgi:hypothetical protein
MLQSRGLFAYSEDICETYRHPQGFEQEIDYISGKQSLCDFPHSMAYPTSTTSKALSFANTNFIVLALEHFLGQSYMVYILSPAETHTWQSSWERSGLAR